MDPETKYLRVATRETFIGRRRDLQACLQVLKKPFDNPKATHKAGVFLQGFGGNGKSTLAARLCDRLPDYTKLVWWRQIDQTSLVNTLAKKLDRSQRQILLDFNEELDYRLRDVFGQLNQPFLLILDDFEWNLECPSSSDDYILKAGVAPLLQALVWAIQETNCYHRLIITSRYTFNSPLLEEFYHLKSLPSFKYKESDLEKKLRRLEHFSSGKIDKNYIERALNLADGNPRLLEWLNNEVLSSGNIDTKLRSFENESDVTWRDKIVWRLEEKPQLLTDEALEKVVSNCLIYEIPVPLVALEAVCQSVPNYQKKLQQAQDKGLIEVICNDDRETLYRASHIKHINPHIELPKDASKLSALAATAAKILTELWGNEQNKNEERWAEIFRLSFADQENIHRFRQGFYLMLSVMIPNKQSDRNGSKIIDSALERQLLKANFQISPTHLYSKLDEFLKKEDWKSADEETAWILYQFLVIKGKRKVYKIRENFPVEEIKKVDELWIKYSCGKFSFSVQKRIWKDLGATLFDIEYGSQEKIKELMTIDVCRTIISSDYFYYDEGEDLRILPSEQVKEKLLEFLRADDSLELSENRIRRILTYIFSAKFDKIVNWKHWGHNNLPEWITKNISKEEATEGQFPVRCFTQDLYNRGYHNDMVRHHQLLWEFEDFWTTLPE